MPDINLKKYSDCFYCEYWNKDKIGTCKAFPKGIPLDIASGQFNHHKPHKGDHNIQFKLNEKKIKREQLVQELLEGEK